MSEPKTEAAPDYSRRAAFTVKEWCRDVHPMATAIAYQLFNAGLLKSYKVKARRYIPATEREDFPARQLAVTDKPVEAA